MQFKKIVSSFILIFFFIFVIFIIFNNSKKNILSENIKKCNELEYNQIINLHPDKFSPIDLEVKFFKEKDWKKILFESEVNAKNNKKKYGIKFYDRSKRTDAILKITVNDNLSCKILAKIRPHGLLDDHRDGSSILPSLNIELLDGNIFGITKFILFREHTRGWDNEILVSNILRELGFLSPRTTKISLKYNDQIEKFLFQESISKEFLEINNLREGPFYDGENKYMLYFNKQNNSKLKNIKYILTKHRMINSEWSLKSESNMKISKHGLSILNKFIEKYIPNFETHRILTSDYSFLEKNLSYSNYFKKIPIYDSLNFAMRAEHGLSVDDRIYYFDALNQEYLPIYWDGMSYLVDRFNRVVKDEKSDSILTPSIKLGALEASDAFNKLNKDELYKKITKHKVNINKINFYELILIINNNLIKFNDISKNDLYEPSAKKFDIGFDDLIKIDNNLINNFRFVYEKDNFLEYIDCNIFNDDCFNHNFSKKDVNQLLKSDLKKNNKYYIYTGKLKNNNDNKTFWFQDYLKEKEKKIIVKERNINFKINGNIDYKIDFENRNINFIKKSQYGNVVFNKISLNNWKIKFVNEISKKFEGIDLYNLTGCINFYDSKLEKISIEIENSNCEDAVNFVRSKGSVNNLLIKNSTFDSLDADFSEIVFNNIIVSNSGNDCLDFSYGNYKIDFARIFDCGDKGISAGELSRLKVNEVEIVKADIGVASKDFAVTEIINSNITDVKYCAQAYNKKQEFYGGFINFKNFECRNFENQFQADKISKISNLN